MRLIDADRFINLLIECKDDSMARDALTAIETIIKIVKIQPTAYDVDKVVEQINDKIQNLDNKNKICMDVGDFRASDRLSDKMCAYIDCRKIVKRGGKND